MISILKDIFHAQAQKLAENGLKKSVCIVTVDQRHKVEDSYGFGNGVFLRQDMVLTCLHNMSGMEEALITDHKHNKSWAHPIAYDRDLDSIILQLERPLKGKPAQIGGDTEDFLRNMNARMVTFYHGKQRGQLIGAPTAYAAGIDQRIEKALRIPYNSIRRTFASSHPVLKAFQVPRFLIPEGAFLLLPAPVSLTTKHYKALHPTGWQILYTGH
jgi:hypothetical protein